MQPKKSKEPIKTTFPAKKTIQQFNRFSRYKLKKEAEDLVLDASEDFVELAMARLKQLSKNRGDSKIHLCDIRRWEENVICHLSSDESWWIIKTVKHIHNAGI